MDKRWYDYLVEFHGTRDYYACHDFLEDWWFDIDNPKNHILVAYIQLAVGMYHWRRGNISSANTLFNKSNDKFRINQNKIYDFGIDEPKLFDLIEQLLRSTNNNEEFYDVNLPISDNSIEKRIHNICVERDIILYKKSDLGNDYLINKHVHKHRK